MAPLFIPIRTTPERMEREGGWTEGVRVEKGKEGGGPKGSFGSDLIRVFHDERRERGRDRD